MFNKFILASMCFLGITCIGQTVAADAYSFQIGEPYAIFDFDDAYYFNTGSEILALKVIRRKAIVQKFDTEKPSCTKAKLYEDAFPADFVAESMNEIAGKYYFFYSLSQKDGEKLFAQEIDFKTGEITGNPKLIISANSKVEENSKIGFTKEKVKSKFTFKPTFANEAMLISYRKKEVGSDKENPDVFGLYVFGKELSEIAHREVTMPYSRKCTFTFDAAADAKGAFHLLLKIYHDDSADDKKDKDDLVANYHIELLSGSAAGEMKSSRYDNNDKFLSKLKLVPNANGGVSGVGFYSTGSNQKYNKGLFNNKSSASDDIDGIAAFAVSGSGLSDFQFHKIPNEIINAYEKEKTRERNEEYERNGNGAKMQFLEIRQANAMPDGGLFLGSEQFFRETSTGHGGVDTYSYNNVLAARLNADGSLRWVKKVPKHQADGSGINDKSYQYLFQKGKHEIVFLDNPENKYLTVKSFPEHYNSSKSDFVTVAAINDQDGIAQKSYVYDIDGLAFRTEKFAVKRIIPAGDSAFVVEFYKKDKQDIMVKVQAK